ncbi:3-phosphoserine/phosphohydroxythreonine transaminase [Clostridia bacterium OttesenSCG-928-F22]|nr:3-phosphoserine/phosphohydroxythreonine transaminase [Clostridia bacterium OttesenSCG-928-F22]
MRVYNFSAGPACLPEAVLKKAQIEMVEHQNHGMSVMEMSHRSGMYDEIHNGAIDALKKLMDIPDNYKVLFLQGGASMQFAMVPLNLMNKNNTADFFITGGWSKKAMAQAKAYGKAVAVGSSEDKNFTYIPAYDNKKFNPNADYFHITTNNTLFGTRLRSLPDVGNVPLVADMSSNILSEKSEVMDVSKYGLIYAGAQKNIGPSGLTVVIVREDLLGNAMDITPIMLDYKTHADSNSLYNTPPTFGIYIANLIFNWLLEQGGVEAMQKQNEYKAKLLYDYFDESSMFSATVQGDCRSLMNITYLLPNEDLTKQFLKEAEGAGFVNLKGHRDVGGVRASIYNPMPAEGVEKLVAFMKAFEVKNK